MKSIVKILAAIVIILAVCAQPVLRVRALSDRSMALESVENEQADEVSDPAEAVTPSGIPYVDLPGAMDAFVDEQAATFASLSVEVFRGNETIYSRQAGYADIGSKVAADGNTVYEWASVSKLLIWVSVMQLFEQGKLDLHIDIREYLPEDFFRKLAYDEPITMIHLMNHNAGWQETVYDIEAQDPSGLVDLETALRRFEPAQAYRPGTVTAYSNWGSSLAAFIVQEVSGEEYVSYVHRHILEPLQMEHTSVSADLSDNQWVSEQRQKIMSYLITEDQFIELGTAQQFLMLYPAGAAIGTMDDMVIFAKALVADDGEGGPLFEKEETLTLMKEPTSYFGDSDIARVCHGMWTLQYAADVMGHGGNTAFSANLMFEPTSGLGVVIMANQAGETECNYGILSLVFGEYADNPRVKGIAFEDSKDLSGIYTQARTTVKGFSGINKYLGGLMPLAGTGDANRFQVQIAPGTLTKVGEHQYVLDNQSGWRYLMFESTNADGQTVLEMMSTDVIRENTVTFWLKTGSIILFILIVLASAVTLPVQLTAWIIRKIRKKSKVAQNREIRIMHTVLSLVNVSIGVLFFALIILPMGGGSVKIIPTMLQCIAIGINSLISIVNVAVLVRYWKQSALTRGKKVFYILAAGSGIFVSGFVWYWQLFNFWNC
ncbi:MAG: beta-lactamase family protein [Clostridiales bacterium]|nr:beta-lactamase family protein [Clostridiales bacterium]